MMRKYKVLLLFQSPEGNGDVTDENELEEGHGVTKNVPGLVEVLFYIKKKNGIKN